MKDYILTNNWIDRYNDGELDDDENEYFKRQMALNPLLREEVQIDKQLNFFLMDQEMLELMEKVRAVTSSRIPQFRLMNTLAFAASVIILLSVGVIFYLSGNKFNTKSKPGKQQASLPAQHPSGDKGLQALKPVPQTNLVFPEKQTGAVLLADNFKPMDELELLVGSVTRSAQLKLIVPGSNQSVKAGSRVLFRWIEQSSWPEVAIVIMNNHGTPVLETPALRGGTFEVHTKGFPPGLYYWKILQNDELVLMGKLALY